MTDPDTSRPAQLAHAQELRTVIESLLTHRESLQGFRDYLADVEELLGAAEDLAGEARVADVCVSLWQVRTRLGELAVYLAERERDYSGDHGWGNVPEPLRDP